MDTDLVQRIDQWTAANEYARALNTLEYVSKSHQQYAVLMKKKRHIQLLAGEFANQRHATAQAAEKQQQWSKANDIYLDALDKLPENTFLKTEYQDFITRRDEFLDNLEFKLSISKGSWLIESQPIQKTIATANPYDRLAQKRYQNTIKEMEVTARDLLHCTEVAIQAGRMALAENCLQTASSLNPKHIDEARMKKFRAQLAETHQRRLSVQNEKTRNLINELKQGYSNENLQRAQRHLATIRESDKQNKESRQLAAQLNELLETGITNRIESGRHLYSNGQIEEALSIWIPLQPIAPDNARLQDYIQRAKRVLDKVKKLSNKPPAIPLP
jgi:hypothetical protein